MFCTRRAGQTIRYSLSLAASNYYDIVLGGTVGGPEHNIIFQRSKGYLTFDTAKLPINYSLSRTTNSAAAGRLPSACIPRYIIYIISRPLSFAFPFCLRHTIYNNNCRYDDDTIIKSAQLVVTYNRVIYKIADFSPPPPEFFALS